MHLNKTTGKNFNHKGEMLQSIDVFKDVASFDDVPYFSPSSLEIPIAGSDKQRDLSYGSCIYVSEGGNDNGAWFFKQELIKARKTPILKPVDIEHNPEVIVGVMYDSAIASQNGEIIPEERIELNLETGIYKLLDKNGNEMNDKIDIKTNFVIYKQMFPAIPREISKYQLGNKNGRYFVSMEVFYNKFGYVFDRDESTFIEIKDDLPSRELVSQYEKYVNKIAPDGRHVSKAYLDFTFGGVGITETPANKDSYLLDLAKKSNDHKDASVVDTNVEGKETHIHSKKNNVIFNDDYSSQEDGMITEEMKAAIDKAMNLAMASTPDISKDEARTRVLEACIEDLNKANATLVTELEVANDKIAGVKEESVKVSEDLVAKEVAYSEDIAAKSKEIEDLTTNLNSAQAELDSIRSKQTGLDRMAELETAGIKFGDRRESIIDRVSVMDEDAYAAYKEDMTSVFAAFKPFMSDEEKKKKEEEDKKKAEKAKADKEKADQAAQAAIDNPNLDVPEGADEEFSAAAAASSKSNIAADQKVILENLFRSVTTRSKDHKRGNHNKIF